MEYLENVKEYFGEQLIKRKISGSLKKYFNPIDLMILEQIGLPNSDELSLSFNNDIYLKTDKIFIGKRASFDIFMCKSETGIYQNIEGGNEFLSPSIYSLLKLIYVLENFTVEIRAKQKLGNFYENRKIYSEYLREQLLKIDNKPEFIDDYKNGYFAGYFASLLEQLEFGGI